MQVSGTFRSVPGQIQGNIAENFANVALVATNAFLATNSNLGRPLSGNAPNTTLQILAPQEHYLDRRNELDFRVGKLLRAGRHRALVSIDFFNALNSNAVVNVNQASNLAATGGGLASYLASDGDPECPNDEVHGHVRLLRGSRLQALGSRHRAELRRVPAKPGPAFFLRPKAQSPEPGALRPLDC